MGLSESLLFYLLIGLGVAAAVAISADPHDRGQRVFQSLSALLFWPLYLPILLTATSAAVNETHTAADLPEDSTHDELGASIAQVEGELDAALTSLDGWAEEALAREHDRIAELRFAWRSQAERIRQMDRLLAFSEPWPAESEGTGRAVQSEQARRQNMARLWEVRNQAHDDLTATLASVRELVSMIHLAKFTGAPASRAEELVAQVAAAVEGLSEVAAWNDTSAIGA